MVLEPLKIEAMTTYKRLKSKGAEEETERYVIQFLQKGYNVEEIASLLEQPLAKVRSIVEKYLKSQG